MTSGPKSYEALWLPFSALLGYNFHVQNPELEHWILRGCEKRKRETQPTPAVAAEAPDTCMRIVDPLAPVEWCQPASRGTGINLPQRLLANWRTVRHNQWWCFQSMKFWVVCWAAAAATETRPSMPPLPSAPTTLGPRLLLPPFYLPTEPELQPCRATRTSTMSHGLLRQHVFSRVIISRVFIPTCQSDSHSSFKIWPTCYVIPFKKHSLPSLSLGCISFTSVSLFYNDCFYWEVGTMLFTLSVWRHSKEIENEHFKDSKYN